MPTVNTSDVSRAVVNLTKYGRDLEKEKRDRIDEAKDDLEPLAEELANRWSAAGLSDREALVAAYRELGLTNAAIAVLLELSESTVNEYQRRGSKKIDEARRLITLADASVAFEKDILCKICGERIRRSHGDITTDGQELRVKCRSCYEEHTRDIPDR